ncbi:MAG: hypothetical protein RLZZ466_1235, partial [Bacteroidota bacterium]
MWLTNTGQFAPKMDGQYHRIFQIKVLNTSENWYRMNIDKGNQSIGGADMKVIGDFANGTDQNVYKIKQLNTATPLNVKANQQGEIWLVIGT